MGRRSGPLDGLVNNAGIIRRADAVDYTEADWDDVMDVNLKALFLLSKPFGGAWSPAKRRGKIVNVASLLSFQGGIRVAAYTATQARRRGPHQVLANEWAAKGINVNAIAPGYIETNNTLALRDDPERCADILERIPAGRWGRPADIGDTAVYLAPACRLHARRHSCRWMAAGWRADQELIDELFPQSRRGRVGPTEPGVKRRILTHLDDLMIVEVAFEKDAVGSLHRIRTGRRSFIAEGAFDVTISGRRSGWKKVAPSSFRQTRFMDAWQSRLGASSMPSRQPARNFSADLGPIDGGVAGRQ